MSLSKFTGSFLADDILRMRYVPINGQLRKMLMVVKMRRGSPSIHMHEYRIAAKGLVSRRLPVGKVAWLPRPVIDRFSV